MKSSIGENSYLSRFSMSRWVKNIVQHAFQYTYPHNALIHTCTYRHSALINHSPHYTLVYVTVNPQHNLRLSQEKKIPTLSNITLTLAPWGILYHESHLHTLTSNLVSTQLIMPRMLDLSWQVYLLSKWLWRPYRQESWCTSGKCLAIWPDLSHHTDQNRNPYNHMTVTCAYMGNYIITVTVCAYLCVCVCTFVSVSERVWLCVCVCVCLSITFLMCLSTYVPH